MGRWRAPRGRPRLEWSGVTSLRSDYPLVRVGAPVAVELPVVTDPGDLLEVEVADDDLLLVGGGDLADVVAARVAEVRRAVEVRRVGAELADLLPDAVAGGDEVLVRRGGGRLL